MKKLILSALVVGSLLATSCKETKEAGKDITDATKEVATTVTEETKDLANKTTEVVKSALEGVTIPEFKDPKVGAYLTEYSEYAKEYIAAGAEGYKNTDLMKKGTDLAAKAQEVIKGLDAESAKKFTATLTSIASKMAPAVK